MALYDITALDSPLEFDTTNGQSISAVKVPGNNWVAVSWAQSTTVFNVQVFSVDTGTGAMAAIGSPVDFQGGTAGVTTDGTSLVAIDGSNLIVAYQSTGGDGFARLISIDGTGNCSLNGSAFEFDNADAADLSMVLWDSTHVLVVWQGTSVDGFALVLVFNTTLGTVAAVGTAFEFDETLARYPSVAQLSSTKAIVTYRDTLGDAAAIVLDVAAVTYAVTAAGAKATFDTSTDVSLTDVVVVSTGSPMVVAVHWIDNAINRVTTLSINTSTWAISDFGTDLELGTNSAVLDLPTNRSFILIDSTHLLLTAPGAADDGFIYVFSYDSGTGALATVDSLEFDAGNNRWNGLVEVQSGLYVNAWTGVADDGFIQAFSVEMPASVSTANFFPFFY